MLLSREMVASYGGRAVIQPVGSRLTRTLTSCHHPGRSRHIAQVKVRQKRRLENFNLLRV